MEKKTRDTLQYFTDHTHQWRDILCFRASLLPSSFCFYFIRSLTREGKPNNGLEG